ncbi:hypothetical protein ACFQBQ_16425 [Granulicella cerasi]|uniref:RES domain-containing protein n=1 Tax=Granulicella cerasi TaxID=741063 RepID=A0ABW1ZDR9_9BACT|nr:hypothetical protein [Granulicella cerasi]
MALEFPVYLPEIRLVRRVGWNELDLKLIESCLDRLPQGPFHRVPSEYGICYSASTTTTLLPGLYKCFVFEVLKHPYGVQIHEFEVLAYGDEPHRRMSEATSCPILRRLGQDGES